MCWVFFEGVCWGRLLIVGRGGPEVGLFGTGVGTEWLG